MNEIVGSFGPERNLVGTFAIPTCASPQPIGFILLNAGIVHRIGPHRLNVKLARGLAKAGFASLRFDLSGQGDSRASIAGVHVLQRAVLDMQAAMDHMQRTVGIRQFAVAGLCSGAHHGVSTALADNRVVGLWLYDSFIYPNAKTRRTYYRRRLRNDGISAITGWLARNARFVFSPRIRNRAVGPTDLQMSEYWQVTPARDEYGGMLQALVDRGVHIEMMHSGSFLEGYNYANQFRDTFRDFPMSNVVQCTFRPEMDHSVTAVHAQHAIIAAICRWAQSLSTNSTTAGGEREKPQHTRERSIRAQSDALSPEFSQEAP